MRIARDLGGAIINADSMQIYKEIPLITASPTKEEKEEIPHYLYNFLSVDQDYSVMQYTLDAKKSIEHVMHNNLLPIVVGGTGFYINSLLYGGINSIPDVSCAANKATHDMELYGCEWIVDQILTRHGYLGCNPKDKQRVMRIYQVSLATNKHIKEFYDTNKQSPIDLPTHAMVLNPCREKLYQVCEQRLQNMFSDQAVMSEAMEVMQSSFGKTSIKAIGLVQLRQHLLGELSLEQALLIAQQKTKQFAKRQISWFKNHMKNDYQNIIIKQYNML